tara:strand:+ start:13615 stop:13716 length:102 start_codon:yes stop_codon:yes gene_type:complete
MYHTFWTQRFENKNKNKSEFFLFLFVNNFFTNL